MDTSIAQAVMMFVLVNIAAMFLLVVMSFVGSALALTGLEKLDVWMRRRDEKRQPPPPHHKAV